MAFPNPSSRIPPFLKGAEQGLCVPAPPQLPARVPPRQPAKHPAAGRTAPWGHGRETLHLLPQVILLSDGPVEVGRSRRGERRDEMESHRPPPPHTHTAARKDRGKENERETERKEARESEKRWREVDGEVNGEREREQDAETGTQTERERQIDGETEKGETEMKRS